MPVDKLKLKSLSTGNKNTTGFTLVEVLVVVAVTWILISAVSMLLVGGLNLQRISVAEGGFAVRAQRLLNEMVDGTEGLIGAKDVLVGKGILSFTVGEPAVELTYQLIDGTIIKKREGDSIPVLKGVKTFEVSQNGRAVEIVIEPDNNTESKSSVYRTSVVPRNI